MFNSAIDREKKIRKENSKVKVFSTSLIITLNCLLNSMKHQMSPKQIFHAIMSIKHLTRKRAVGLINPPPPKVTKKKYPRYSVFFHRNNPLTSLGDIQTSIICMSNTNLGLNPSR